MPEGALGGILEGEIPLKFQDKALEKFLDILKKKIVKESAKNPRNNFWINHGKGSFSLQFNKKKSLKKFNLKNPTKIQGVIPAGIIGGIPEEFLEKSMKEYLENSLK